MRHGHLRLRFSNDGDGTGKLLAEAEAQGFSGRGAAWFGIQKLEEFANAIATFPLPTEGRLSISGGFWKDSKLSQEHLAIEIYPIDTRGHLGVQVRTASELWDGSRPQSQMTSTVEIITSYQPLSDFSRKLKALVQGLCKEVSFEGDIVS